MSAVKAWAGLAAAVVMLSLVGAAAGGLLILATSVYHANASSVRGGTAASVNVGQRWAPNPRRFWGRPVAASGSPGALAASAGRRRREVLASAPAVPARDIPSSLLSPTVGAPDPNVSLAAALFQVPRVAQATGLAPAYLRGLVALAIRHPLLGLPGPPYVNLPVLNAEVQAALADRGP